MSSYKRNNDANRDSLFGAPPKKPSDRAGPRHKRNNEANRDALFGNVGGDKSKSSNRKKTPKATASAKPVPSRGYDKAAKPKLSLTLTGAAKMAKLKEAEENRDKGTQAMERGVFKRPDPVAAGNFYLRAADAYALCGENRLERLHRIASADCQMGSGTFASAAREYMKAAKLSKDSDETLERKRKEGNKLYSDAAKAWTEAGEVGKAASAAMEAAMAWLWEDETTFMNRKALTAIEEAIEQHVPDVLNPYMRFRQTGVSNYVDAAKADEQPSPHTMSMAREALVKTPYAHEPLQDATHVLVRYGEYQSALYCCGAASAMLENDGVATLTLGRNYCEETIITLAMGDPILAEDNFLKRHVQNSSYLTSRECKLSEELYKAIMFRDESGLEEARAPDGGNRAALANLNSHLRALVQSLRLSGAAKKTYITKTDVTKILDDDDDGDDIKLAAKPPKSKKSHKKSKSQKKDSEADKSDLFANQKRIRDDEKDPDVAGVLQDLDDLGDLGDSGGDDPEEEEIDDDDIDLR